MVRLKVLVDGEPLGASPRNSVKVIVEGLGEGGKDQVHVGCSHEGLTLDAVRDDEIDSTQYSMWEEIASQMGDLDRSQEPDDPL